MRKLIKHTYTSLIKYYFKSEYLKSHVLKDQTLQIYKVINNQSATLAFEKINYVLSLFNYHTYFNGNFVCI